MKKKKAKDATGSPHNLANQKRRGTAKAKNKPGISREHSSMDHKKANDLSRSGNDADRELDYMRSMNKQHSKIQRRKK